MKSPAALGRAVLQTERQAKTCWEEAGLLGSRPNRHKRPILLEPRGFGVQFKDGDSRLAQVVEEGLGLLEAEVTLLISGLRAGRCSCWAHLGAFFLRSPLPLSPAGSPVSSPPSLTSVSHFFFLMEFGDASFPPFVTICRIHPINNPLTGPEEG